ncbi:MAG: CCA tRNA nucleotidyltransferase, partial [Erysipelotrichaceae bacterium]
MSNYQVYFSEEIKVLMDLLSSHHHELVVVGGWVRDILLGRKPTDVDMASNLSPKEMLKLLKDYPTSMIGIKYGTVGVKINNTWIEITTYRSDHNTLDHRHPSSNQFIDSLEADLKRRDFTINALAINQAGDLVDYVGGLEDLKNQRIKAIGQPDERFSEDALRILRAMRFAITLDFMIDDETQVAMLKQRQLLKHISSERIWEELMKMLNGQHIQSIFLTNAKILLDLLPQSHIPSYLDQTKDPTIRLWMLLDRLDQSNLTKVLQH